MDGEGMGRGTARGDDGGGIPQEEIRKLIDWSVERGWTALQRLADQGAPAGRTEPLRAAATQSSRSGPGGLGSRTAPRIPGPAEMEDEGWFQFLSQVEAGAAKGPVQLEYEVWPAEVDTTPTSAAARSDETASDSASDSAPALCPVLQLHPAPTALFLDGRRIF